MSSSEIQKDDKMTVYQCDIMDYVDEELAAILGKDFPGSLSPPDGSDTSSSSTLVGIPTSSSSTTTALSTGPPQVGLDLPPKQRKLDDLTKFCTLKGVADLDRAASAPVILNFCDFANSPENSRQVSLNTNPDAEAVASQGFRNYQGSKGCAENKTRRVRPPSQTYDHIMAERKRREQLSQRFIALSAIVPGLTKMDKTSVLGDTIKYLKHLRGRVKTLEEQAAKQTMESVVMVKRSQIVEDEGSSDEKSWASDAHSLPEIEARVCDKSVVVKIHCEKRKGFLVKVLAEVENLNLIVVNASVTRFGDFALDITIIAEMDEEVSLAAKDIVKTLRSALVAPGN